MKLKRIINSSINYIIYIITIKMKAFKIFYSSCSFPNSEERTTKETLKSCAENGISL